MMEAAQSLGANRFTAFLKVVFPMSLPGIIVGGILVFTGTLTAYTLSLIHICKQLTF